MPNVECGLVNLNRRGIGGGSEGNMADLVIGILCLIGWFKSGRAYSAWRDPMHRPVYFLSNPGSFGMIHTLLGLLSFVLMLASGYYLISAIF
jgi:hypothetical protein